MRRLAIAIAAATPVLAAVPGRAETLADAIALAYRNNPTLAAGRYDLRATDEALVQAKAETRPSSSFEAIGGYDRTVYGRTSSANNPFSPEAFDTNSSQLGVIVQQPLYTGGRATADRRVAEAQIAGGRETLRGAEGDLLLAVITAYCDVRRYGASREVWTASVNELRKLIAEIRARQQAGELTMTDVALANTQLAAAQAQLVDTELNLETARADYAQLVGRDPGQLADTPPLPDVPDSVATAYDLAERQNPDLAQAINTELASRANIDVAASSGRPTVSLRGTATLSGQAYPYSLRDQDQAFSGSVVLTIPLTAGGQVASQIRQAKDRDTADTLRVEAERRQVVRSVSVAWNQMASAERQIDVLDMQERAAAKQLDGMVNEYRVGLRSTFDVLNAQQTLRDTDVSILGAQRDLYVAQATVLRQTGLLEARTIMSGVPLYDPAAHLKHIARRNAVPWDGAVGTLDRLMSPTPRRQPAVSPGAAPAPALVTAQHATQTPHPLSHSLPASPNPGAPASPSRTDGRQH